MTDREKRQHVIEILQEEKKTALHDNKWAFDYAIASIETDLKYDLLYEETSEQADKQADKPTTKNETLVSLGVYKQVAWERDIAIQQLHELGYEFGQKIELTTNNLVVGAVRRKAVLNTLDNMDSALDEDDRTVETYKELLKECYKVLPSVTLIKPKGHWIPMYQGDEIIDYRCSECEFGNTFGKGTFGMNFCPRCGADMSEVEE